MPFGDRAMLHIADAHVKTHIWQSYREVVGDAHTAFSKAVAEGVEQGSDTLLLSGDVFDNTRPTSKDVNAVVEACKKFKMVLYVTGTHDNTDPPWVGLVPHAIHLGIVPAAVGDAVFLGIDYCSTRQQMLEQLSNLCPVIREQQKPTYLVMHNAFRHLLGFEGAWKVELEDIEAISPDLRVIVGDVHTRKTVKLSGNGWVHSAGPLCPQDWGQTSNSCYADVIDISTGNITPVCTDVRKYHHIALEDVASFKDEEPLELPTVVKVDVPAGTTSGANIQIPCCIVIPTLVQISSETASEYSEVGKSLEEVVKTYFEDPEDGELLWQLYTSDAPKKVLYDLLEKEGILVRT